MTRIPAAVAFLAVGWNDIALGPYPLPFALDPYGLTGCELLHSADFAALPVAPLGAGTAHYALALPNAPGLIGVHMFLQGWAHAPGVNPAAAIVSNGLRWQIGSL